jgi:hypothetical protein
VKYLYSSIFGSVVWCCVSAGAIPIEYTLTGMASGRLGTTVFANADYTITCIANTTQIVTSGSVRSVLDTSATISIAGVGTATITVPFYTYDNQGDSWVGFYDGAGTYGPRLENTDFKTYALASSIGPVGGSSTTVGGGFNTTDGLFDPSSQELATFQASTVVPDAASTLCLLGLGLLALAGFNWGVAKTMAKAG